MLRRPIDRILVNASVAGTLTPVTGGVFVKDYGEILAAQVVGCVKVCTVAGTNKQVTVDVDIPESCECPYEWGVTIEGLPDDTLYEVSETFKTPRFYGYEDPAGGTPTAAATAAAIAAQINADPNAQVTATVAADVITLTGKNGRNFNVYTASGTVVVTVPYVKPQLSSDLMSRLFPIQPSDFGSRPTLPVAGNNYCKYSFKIRKSNAIQDIDAANHLDGYEQEVEFYVNSTDAGYAANWSAEIVAAFPLCTSF